MLNKIAKSRKLKKISMAAGILTMGIGIITSLSSFDDSGSGGGTGTEEFEKPKWTPVTQYVSCDDITTNISFTQKSDGKFGVSADLGKLGKYAASIEDSGSGRTGSGTISNYKISFPSNADGTPMKFLRILCPGGGSSRCTPTEPCLQIAIGQIKSAL